MSFSLTKKFGSVYQIDKTPFLLMVTLSENDCSVSSSGRKLPNMFAAIEAHITMIMQVPDFILPDTITIPSANTEFTTLSKFMMDKYFIYPQNNKVPFININIDSILTSSDDYYLYNIETKKTIGTFNIGNACSTPYTNSRRELNTTGVIIYQNKKEIGHIVFQIPCSDWVDTGKGFAQFMFLSPDDKAKALKNYNFSYTVKLNDNVDDIDLNPTVSNYGGALLFRLRDKYLKR